MRKPSNHAVLTAICFMLLLSLSANVITVLHVADQRKAAIREACDNQNENHANVHHKLHHIFGEAVAHAKTEAQKRQVVATEQPTYLIIDALAPWRDCARVVHKQAAPPL